MNFDFYKGKQATIKSTGEQGTIVNVRYKRGADNSLGARFDVQVPEKEYLYEVMPHEIKVHE